METNNYDTLDHKIGQFLVELEKIDYSNLENIRLHFRKLANILRLNNELNKRLDIAMEKVLEDLTT